MNDATKNESGVKTTTTSAIIGLIVNMKTSVPRMVTMPENTCVKPCKSPVPTISMSVTTVLIRSPWGVLSMKDSGTRVSFSITSLRICSTV